MILGYFDTNGVIVLGSLNSHNPGLGKPDLFAIEFDQNCFGGFFDELGLDPDVILGVCGLVEPGF